MPTVSVIIPIYNSSKWIEKTIESVLCQTYGDLETVIVDDGSTDDTAEIVKKYKNRAVRYFYQKNKGVSAARNKGIEVAGGKYIALLDHDDLWMPEKIEKQLHIFNNKPDTGLVYSDAFVIDENGRVLYRVFEKLEPHSGKIYRNLFLVNFIPCLTAVIPKRVFEDVGLFPEEYTMAEEYDLFLRIAEKYKIEYVKEPLAKYRVHGESISSRKFVLGYTERIDIIEKMIKNKSPMIPVVGEKPVRETLAYCYYGISKTDFFEGKTAECRINLKKSFEYSRKNIKGYLLWVLSYGGKPASRLAKLCRKIIIRILPSRR